MGKGLSPAGSLWAWREAGLRCAVHPTAQVGCCVGITSFTGPRPPDLGVGLRSFVSPAWPCTDPSDRGSWAWRKLGTVSWGFHLSGPTLPRNKGVGPHDPLTLSTAKPTFHSHFKLFSCAFLALLSLQLGSLLTVNPARMGCVRVARTL